MAKLTIETIEKNLSLWKIIKEVWESPVIAESEVTEENLEIFIFQAYLHYQSVQDVTSIVNNLGFRTISDAGNIIKYSSNNISDIIRNHDIENAKLQAVCQYILTQNSAAIDRLYN